MLKPDESLLLDFLRAFSTFLVLAAHAQQILVNPTWMPFSLSGRSDVVPFVYSQIGALGVMIFFVLSGFLITYSIANNLKTNSFEKFDAVRYFKGRLRRLFPPLFFSQGVVLLVFGVLYFFDANSSTYFATGKELYLARSELEFNIIDYFGSLFFLNTIVNGVNSPVVNGPLWSVAHEFWFYVLAGLSVLSFYNRKMLFALAVLLAFLVSQENVFFLYGFGVWLFGCLIAILHMTKFYERKFMVVMTILVVMLAVWGGLIYFNADSNIKNRHKFVFGVAFSFLLLFLLNGEQLMRFFSRSWLFRKIAEQASYSYTLYLIHFPLLLLIWVFTNKYSQGNIPLTFAVVIASVVFVILVSASASSVVESDAKKKSRLRHLPVVRFDSIVNSKSTKATDTL